MATLPKDVKLDADKVSHGCLPEESSGQQGVLECVPTVQFKGREIPLTEDSPVILEEVSPGQDKFRFKKGGRDMTDEQRQVFKEALKRDKLSY